MTPPCGQASKVLAAALSANNRKKGFVVSSPFVELLISVCHAGRRGAMLEDRGNRDFSDMPRAIALARSAVVTMTWLGGPVLSRAGCNVGIRFLTIDKEQVYDVQSQAGPGNDINAGSRSSQKAPTRDSASLVTKNPLLLSSSYPCGVEGGRRILMARWQLCWDSAFKPDTGCENGTRRIRKDDKRPLSFPPFQVAGR